HGGFYRHFSSKEELFAEAVAKGFEEAAVRIEEAIKQAPAGSEVRTIIERYLSLEHCANPADGCPLASLMSESARYPRSLRTKIDRAMREHFSKIVEFLPGASEQERGRNCLILFSGMVIGYWEQACALLNYGLLHEDLFFETSGEFFGVWELLKLVVPQFRERFANKNLLANLEQAAQRHEAWSEQRAPGHIAALRQFMQQRRAQLKTASTA